MGQDSHQLLKYSTCLIIPLVPEKEWESVPRNSGPWGVVYRAKGQSQWKVLTVGWGLLLTLTFGDAVLSGQEALLEEALQHRAHGWPVDQLQHEEVGLRGRVDAQPCPRVPTALPTCRLCRPRMPHTLKPLEAMSTLMYSRSGTLRTSERELQGQRCALGPVSQVTQAGFAT